MNKSCIISIIFALLLSINGTFAYDNGHVTSEELSRSYINQASTKFMKNDIDGAIESLDEAIRINPNSPLLYLNRGFIKHVIREYDGAMDDYNTALRINPNFAFAYNSSRVSTSAIETPAKEISDNDVQSLKA